MASPIFVMKKLAGSQIGVPMVFLATLSASKLGKMTSSAWVIWTTITCLYLIAISRTPASPCPTIYTPIVKQIARSGMEKVEKKRIAAKAIATLKKIEAAATKTRGSSGIDSYQRSPVNTPV